MSKEKILLLRCLADDRSPVSYLANEKTASWALLLELRSEGLVSIGEPGPAKFGSFRVCTLAEPASDEMTRVANDYARALDGYSLQETEASRELLAQFAESLKPWVLALS